MCKGFFIATLLFLSACSSIPPGKPGSEKIALLYAPDPDLFQLVTTELGAKGCRPIDTVYGKPNLGTLGGLNKARQVKTTIIALQEQAMRTSSNIIVSSLVLESKGAAMGSAYFCKPSIVKSYLEKNPYPAPWL